MANIDRDIPYIAHERMMARLERTIKRLWILLILLVGLLFGTNLAWILYESQFTDEETIRVEQENDSGNNNYIGHDGDITNGKANDNNH